MHTIVAILILLFFCVGSSVVSYILQLPVVLSIVIGTIFGIVGGNLAAVYWSNR